LNQSIFWFCNKEGDFVGFLPAYLHPDYPYIKVKNKNLIVRKAFAALNYCGVHIDHGKALVCEPPGSPYSRMLCRQGYEQQVGQAIASKLSEVCKQEKIAMNFCSSVLEPDNLNYCVQNPESDFIRFSTRRNYKLEVAWSSFDGYLSSLPHRRANSVKREIRQFKEAGIVVRLQQDFTNYSEKMTDLFKNNWVKYEESEDSPFQPSFFEALYKNAQDSTKILFATKDDRIIGFTLLYQQNKTLDAIMVGLDCDAFSKADFVYFNLVYYEPVKLAVAEGIERIYYRWSADEAKLSRNCQPERTYCYLATNSKILKLIFKTSKRLTKLHYL
jgi:predicted N-acyltransferase